MSGLQSLILARAILTPSEEAVTATTSLVLQQATVSIRTMRTVTSDSGALYICRPEPWVL